MLTLYSGAGKRQTPFHDGYRPLFAVREGELASGMIELQDRSELRPGEAAVVNVRFVRRHAFAAGMRIQFFEAAEPLGHVEVLPE